MLKKLSSIEEIMNKETKANPIKVRMYLNIEVQILENPNVPTNKYSVINKMMQVYEENITPKVNKKNTTSMKRKTHITKTPYLHSNPKIKYFN